MATAAEKVDVLPLDEAPATEFPLDERRASDRDASVTQHREAASFFDTLLAVRESTDEPTPMEETVKEKVRKMSFLQSELEYVISLGLESKAREEWVLRKMALEEKKRVCKQQWAELQARQQTTTEAFDQLAAKAVDGMSSSPGHEASSSPSSALALGTEWTTSTILTQTSLKQQVTLLEEHVALSRRQVALDEEDETLMKVALELYQEEQVSRDRRAEILEQQQVLLSELSSLVEDTSAFNGHRTFVDGGFAEGLTY